VSEPAPDTNTGTPTKHHRGADILRHAPVDATDLIGWLGMLDATQVDRVWIAAVAELLVDERIGIAELLGVLRYVRVRYQQEIRRVGLGGTDPATKSAARALRTLIGDRKRGEAIAAGWARRRARLAAEAQAKQEHHDDRAGPSESADPQGA